MLEQWEEEQHGFVEMSFVSDLSAGWSTSWRGPWAWRADPVHSVCCSGSCILPCQRQRWPCLWWSWGSVTCIAELPAIDHIGPPDAGLSSPPESAAPFWFAVQRILKINAQYKSWQAEDLWPTINPPPCCVLIGMAHNKYLRILVVCHSNKLCHFSIVKKDIVKS